MTEPCTKIKLTDGSTIVHLPGTLWRVFDADGRAIGDFASVEGARDFANPRPLVMDSAQSSDRQSGSASSLSNLSDADLRSRELYLRAASSRAAGQARGQNTPSARKAQELRAEWEALNDERLRRLAR